MGILFLIIADVVLAYAGNLWGLALGVALWGLHMGFTEGLLVAIVSDTTPAALRGTAYGVYGFIRGLAMLTASLIAGVLWDNFGPTATFLTGAVFAATALAGFLTLGLLRHSR